MTYEEIMMQCYSLYIREEDNICMDGPENYEWKIGHAVLDKITGGIGFRKGRIPDKIIMFMGIPVQIDYLRSECLELWKKVG